MLQMQACGVQGRGVNQELVSWLICLLKIKKNLSLVQNKYIRGHNIGYQLLCDFTEDHLHNLSSFPTVLCISYVLLWAVTLYIIFG